LAVNALNVAISCICTAKRHIEFDPKKVTASCKTHRHLQIYRTVLNRISDIHFMVNFKILWFGYFHYSIQLLQEKKKLS